MCWSQAGSRGALGRGGPLAEGLAQFVDGIRQVQDLSVELCHECVQLVDRVQDLDALRVRVESHLEGSRHGGHPATELLLGVLEALGDVVDGLVLLILVRLEGGGGGVEGAQLGLVADGVQELTVGGQEASAVRLDFAIFLAETELDSEPVDLWGSKQRETRRRD